MKYLKIPYIYPSGHDVVLTCDFDLEGETLYAVKWFHDGEEFYRYSPDEDPKAMFFPVRGIKVDVSTYKSEFWINSLIRMSYSYLLQMMLRELK
ncbi:hypothetical protein AVEN_238921-1 [Araneus ventricosus]|uniref:Ig-like domain-containing protein n=1 Tax=Araneus ventricosus TaxID=182803 RepID=A0A4Y2DFN1_ARAVE|nr:hypothetical protein AVEN_238921-1 [Araneus ventricosus]